MGADEDGDQVVLALSPMVRPGVQDTREHAALAAALLIGAQLLLGYWFYSYLTWFYPLLIIAMIRARPGREAAPNLKGMNVPLGSLEHALRYIHSRSRWREEVRADAGAA